MILQGPSAPSCPASQTALCTTSLPSPRAPRCHRHRRAMPPGRRRYVWCTVASTTRVRSQIQFKSTTVTFFGQTPSFISTLGPTASGQTSSPSSAPTTAPSFTPSTAHSLAPSQHSSGALSQLPYYPLINPSSPIHPSHPQYFTRFADGARTTGVVPQINGAPYINGSGSAIYAWTDPNAPSVAS